MLGKREKFVHLHQTMERVWLVMALISSALSDHPLIRSSHANRHCVDRARKALFDLYKTFEEEAENMEKKATAAGSAGARVASDIDVGRPHHHQRKPKKA